MQLSPLYKFIIACNRHYINFSKQISYLCKFPTEKYYTVEAITSTQLTGENYVFSLEFTLPKDTAIHSGRSPPSGTFNSELTGEGLRTYIRSGKLEGTVGCHIRLIVKKNRRMGLVVHERAFFLWLSCFMERFWIGERREKGVCNVTLLSLKLPGVSLARLYLVLDYNRRMDLWKRSAKGRITILYSQSDLFYFLFTY